MPGTIDFFRVGNADMTLITLSNGYTVLVDCYLLEEKTDLVAVTVDDLCTRLNKDGNGRPAVDVFLETHPDDDHCHGAKTYLHLRPMSEYADEPKGDNARKKIVVREMWSSPLVYRRHSPDHKLTDDAVAINSEAKRRVEAFRVKKAANDRAGKTTSLSDMADCERVRVIGEDYKKDGLDRLAGLDAIRVSLDDTFVIRDRNGSPLMSVNVLAPLPVVSDADEAVLTKNNSSVIVRFGFHFYGGATPTWYALFGGDAEAEIWRRLYKRHKGDLSNRLGYDLLLAPHHCSWGVLSVEAASAKAGVDATARMALEQTDDGYVVASSKKIINDDDNPPAHRAKVEYIDILDDAMDHFYCTGEVGSGEEGARLTFGITVGGPQPPSRKAPATSAASASAALAGVARPHG